MYFSTFASVNPPSNCALAPPTRCRAERPRPARVRPQHLYSSNAVARRAGWPSCTLQLHRSMNPTPSNVVGARYRDCTALLESEMRPLVVVNGSPRVVSAPWKA